MFWLIGGRELSLAAGRMPVSSAVRCVRDPSDASQVAGVCRLGPGHAGVSLRGGRVDAVCDGQAARARRLARVGVLADRAPRGGAVDSRHDRPGDEVLPDDMDGMELYSNALQAIAVGYLVTSLALLHLRVRGQIVLFAVPGAGLRRPADVRAVRRPSGRDAGANRQPRPLRRRAGAGRLPPRSLASRGCSRASALPPRCSWGRWPATCCGRDCRPAASSLWLAAIGLACMAVGWVWSYWLPLNRHLWTSSMILWAGGWSFLLLALVLRRDRRGGDQTLGLSAGGHRRQRPAGLRARPRLRSDERHAGVDPDPAMPRPLP